ncbi:MAG: PHP domain-containing protein [Candidatus Abyssobacteria bacterium SURF_5]|uniref:PHP domain-containing protein n=1 Tax=Abyssobacteria bacterium (strain SURF_5) TaxID=2093360 RepID=A0A3A4NZP1_ABYX5|nr:MAG: PHP domain-containing protein [Candidatus Abyssubacteria bacterium SURF_5]
MMKIDLHCHTSPLSTCSAIKIHDLIPRAKEAGIDGICLTEHNKLWPRDEVMRLRERFEFPIFRGMEVTTRDGDILVFGFEEEPAEIISAAELHKKVSDCGGFTIVAHPFRGFLVFNFVQLSLSPERAATRPVFQAVDAIEAYNCKINEQETQMALDVSARLGIPCVAGSDAHILADVGKYYTHFSSDTDSDEDLVVQLRTGNFSIYAPEKGANDV